MMKSSIKSTYYASSNPFVSFASSGCAPEINEIRFGIWILKLQSRAFQKLVEFEEIMYISRI